MKLSLPRDGAGRAAADAGELQDVGVAPVHHDVYVGLPCPPVLMDVRGDAPAVHEAVQIKVKGVALHLACHAEASQIYHPDGRLGALD